MPDQAQQRAPLNVVAARNESLFYMGFVTMHTEEHHGNSVSIPEAVKTNL